MYNYDSLLEAIIDPNGREIFDPATGDLIGHAPEHTTADVDALAELLSREQGKPLNGPNALF